MMNCRVKRSIGYKTAQRSEIKGSMVAMCFKINPTVPKWSKVDVEATRMVRY